MIKRNGQNQGTILSCFLYNISNSSCSEVSIGPVSGSVWSVTVNISGYLLSRQHYTAEMVFDNEAGNASETVRTFSELSLNISQLIVTFVIITVLLLTLEVTASICLFYFICKHWYFIFKEDFGKFENKSSIACLMTHTCCIEI